LYIAAKFKIQKGGREIFDNLIFSKEVQRGSRNTEISKQFERRLTLIEI